MKTEIQALRNILAELYPEKPRIRRVIDDAELDLARIELDAASLEIWHFILLEGEKVGRIDALLLVIEREYGSNLGFRAACNAYRQAAGQLGQNYDQGYFPKALPQGSEPLMNCVHEIAAFHELLDNAATTQRAILLQGDHGCGKTRLLKEYRRLAEARGRRVVHFDLGRQLSVEHCLERIVDNFADPTRFTTFEQHLRKKKPERLSLQADWHEDLTRAFFTDLRVQRAVVPIFVFFDQLEKADQSLRNWLLDKFVAGLSNRPLLAVLAGHAELERVQHLEWVLFFMPKIPQIEHFYEYARLYSVQFEPEDMNALFAAFQATPKSFVDYVNAKHLQQRGQLA